jgi:cobalt-zinc-cadmium efflux system protein
VKALVPWADTPAHRGLVLALRLAVGAVFIYASIDKIVHPDRFAEIVWDFDMLPEGLVNPFSACLPWIELVMGISLVAGLWVPSAALISLAMTVMFMMAVGHALARGAEDFHCGCFTTVQEGPDEAWAVMWRDAVLLAGIIWLFLATFAGRTPRPDR